MRAAAFRLRRAWPRTCSSGGCGAALHQECRHFCLGVLALKSRIANCIFVLHSLERLPAQHLPRMKRHRRNSDSPCNCVTRRNMASAGSAGSARAARGQRAGSARAARGQRAGSARAARGQRWQRVRRTFSPWVGNKPSLFQWLSLVARNTRLIRWRVCPFDLMRAETTLDAEREAVQRRSVACHLDCLCGDVSCRSALPRQGPGGRWQERLQPVHQYIAWGTLRLRLIRRFVCSSKVVPRWGRAGWAPSG